MQISRYLFNNAQTSLAAMQMELAASDGYKARPTTLNQLMSIFPKGLYDAVWKDGAPKQAGSSSAKGKEKEVASAASLIDVSQADLVDQILKFKAQTMGKQEEKVAKKGRGPKAGKSAVTAPKKPRRDCDLMSARVSAVTTCHWPATGSKPQRDLQFFCAVGVTEHFLLHTVRYREALLPTALGFVRLQLHGILDPCVKPHAVAVLGSPPQMVTTWQFIDRLETPTTAKCPNVNLKALRVAGRRDREREANRAFLRGIRTKIENHPGAWATAEDDEPNTLRSLDSDVADTADAMLEAMWTNMERIVYRDSVHNVNAEFNVADQEVIPPDCLTTRDTARDAHTVDGRVGPSHAAPRTPANAKNARRAPRKEPLKEDEDDPLMKIDFPVQKPVPVPTPRPSTPAVDEDTSMAVIPAPSPFVPRWKDDGPNANWPERLQLLNELTMVKGRTLADLAQQLRAAGMIAPVVHRQSGFYTKAHYIDLHDTARHIARSHCPDALESPADPATAAKTTEKGTSPSRTPTPTYSRSQTPPAGPDGQHSDDSDMEDGELEDEVENLRSTSATSSKAKRARPGDPADKGARKKRRKDGEDADSDDDDE